MNDLDGFEASKAIGLTQAAKMMRGRRGAPAVDTLRRWASPKRGWRAWPGGPVVFLRVVRLNGELVTTEAWVKAFEAERIRLGERRPPEGPVIRSAGERRRGHQRAEAYLDQQGVRGPRQD